MKRALARIIGANPPPVCPCCGEPPGACGCGGYRTR
jgi:hypothetical protein